MKKTLRTVIAILTAGLMLMSFAACDENNNDAADDNTVKEDAVMKAVYEDITSDGAYISWKEIYPDATIEEKLDGNKLTFTVTYKGNAPSEEEGDITNDAEIAAGTTMSSHMTEITLSPLPEARKNMSTPSRFRSETRSAIISRWTLAASTIILSQTGITHTSSKTWRIEPRRFMLRKSGI